MPLTRSAGLQLDLILFTQRLRETLRDSKEIFMQTFGEWATAQLNTNEGLAITGKDKAETFASIKAVIDAIWKCFPVEYSVTGEVWHLVQGTPTNFGYRFRIKRDPVVQALETLTRLRDQMANMCLTGFVSQVDSAINELKQKGV